ncbi:hypothetical protein [Chitinophaga sp. YR573]|nr:hypothetical protein [Chitinophaga sp. YR573]
MNTISTFLTQTYVPGIPNYMVAMAPVVIGLAILTLTRGGLIRHFINYGK